MSTVCEDFLPISVATLAPIEAGLGIELYRHHPRTNRYELYRGVSHPLRQKDITRLEEGGCRRLYISSAARDDYQKYLAQVLGIEGDGQDVSSAIKVSALSEVVRDTLKTAFRNKNTETSVAACHRLGRVTAKIISQDDFSGKALFQVLRHDYATFNHSANVAFYAGILAKKLGYTETDTYQIITGGLLHDLGKLEIDDRILSKPERLTPEERERVKRHPALGLQKLADRDDLTEGQLMMVYQHHERIDGEGYPSGLIDEEIHPWAKLCAVVDVYDALTGCRPYRKPMEGPLVEQLLERDCGNAFDSEILKCWVSITQTFSPS